MTDIDSGWDPKKGTLQQHREAKLKEAKQPGFGAMSEKAKSRRQTQPATKPPQKEDDAG